MITEDIPLTEVQEMFGHYLPILRRSRDNNLYVGIATEGFPKRPLYSEDFHVPLLRAWIIHYTEPWNARKHVGPRSVYRRHDIYARQTLIEPKI